MPRSPAVVTALFLLAASCVTATSSVAAKQSSHVEGEHRAHVAAKQKSSVAAKRKEAKRKAAKRKPAKRKATKRKPAVAARPASAPATPRTPVNKNDCIEAAQDFYVQVQTAFRQKKQAIPREVERVVSKLNESCGEEEFEKARIGIDWINACVKSLTQSSCSRDKDYFCAIDPGSEACSSRKSETEKKDPNSR